MMNVLIGSVFFFSCREGYRVPVHGQKALKVRFRAGKQSGML